MRKVIKGATNSRATIFEDRYFDFVMRRGVGIEDTPYFGLEVRTKEDTLAYKHVVEIRLNSKNFPDFHGEPVYYQYKDCYVAHGMRSRADTLEDTESYIYVLEDALEFARRVNKWLEENDGGLDAYDIE